jgi:predicted phage tail protein
MLKKITLGGVLGKKYGRVHRLDCADALDAIRAFCAMLPGFRQDFARLKYRVVLDGAPVTNREELGLPAREIRFAPVVGGSGRGVDEVIVGVLLIVAAYYSAGASTALGFGTAAEWGAAGSMAFSLGASLVLSGIAQAMAQPPQQQQDQANTRSYLFNGPVNSTQQGNPVPILYGQLMIGSQVASANLQAYDIAIGTPTTNTGTSTTIAPNGTITTTNQSVSKGAQ